MEFLSTIYQFFLYQPVFNLLILFSQILPGKDFGVAVILLTILVRLASYPLGAQAVVAQKKFAELQPKIKEIQEKLKNKKEEQTKATLELYKKEKINPFASIVPLLIQIPIFIVLYQIFAGGLHEERLSLLYPFIPRPSDLTPSLFGLVDLNKQSFVLAILAGIFQFVQAKQATLQKKRGAKNKSDVASTIQNQLPYIFPFLIVWVASSLPSAFALYLIATTIFSIWQYWFIARKENAKKQLLEKTHGIPRTPINY